MITAPRFHRCLSTSCEPESRLVEHAELSGGTSRDSTLNCGAVRLGEGTFTHMPMRACLSGRVSAAVERLCWCVPNLITPLYVDPSPSNGQVLHPNGTAPQICSLNSDRYLGGHRDCG